MLWRFIQQGERWANFLSNFFFIVRYVSAVRPCSVTDNLRGRYHTISAMKCYSEFALYLPLTLSVTEDGLVSETCLTMSILLWKLHNIDPTFQNYYWLYDLAEFRPCSASDSFSTSVDLNGSIQNRIRVYLWYSYAQVGRRKFIGVPHQPQISRFNGGSSLRKNPGIKREGQLLIEQSIATLFMWTMRVLRQRF